MRKGLSLLFSIYMFLELLQTGFSQKEVRNRSCQSVLLVPLIGLGFFQKVWLNFEERMESGSCLGGRETPRARFALITLLCEKRTWETASQSSAP